MSKAEAKYQKTIREHGFEEFKLHVELEVRCGGIFSGWVENAVVSTIYEVLPKNGIMVDSVKVSRAAA